MPWIFPFCNLNLQIIVFILIILINQQVNPEHFLPQTFYNISDTVEGIDFVFRVVNGRPASLGQFPYQVGFMMMTKYTFRGGDFMVYCGGALIAPSRIVTAAHCFTQRKGSRCTKGKLDRRDLKKKYAVAGSLRTQSSYKSNGQWLSLRRGRYPEKYEFPYLDIAVVYTESPFHLNREVNVIPHASQNIDYKGYCTASGFGRLSGTILSERLNYASLEVLSIKNCSIIHGKDMSNFVCTSDLISDVHKGDSGGPLVCSNTNDPNDKGQGTVVGVVSGKQTNIRSGTFFTRVSSYSDLLSRSTQVLCTFCICMISLTINCALSQFW